MAQYYTKSHQNYSIHHRTTHDLTQLWRAIQDHIRAIQEHTGSYRIIQDNTSPYKSLQDHKSTQEDHTKVNKAKQL